VDLSVERRSESSVSVVSVAGEVDVHSAPRLREGVSAELTPGASAVVVDLSEVGFLDSTGLGALVSARTTAGERGVLMPVVCTSERIRKLVTITGLDGVFDLHTSLDEALASVPDRA
jgi:anti-sigma B factor antagonist